MSLSSDADIESIVFDIGSHTARAGIAGEEVPTVTMNYWESPEFKESYFENGYELWKNMSYDTDELEKVLFFCYNLLSKDSRMTADELPAVFTEHFHDSLTKRDSVFEIMFEKFNIPSIYIAPSPVLSLYSSGRGSGIVLESGNSVTQTAVIYEGYMFADSVMCENYGGASISRDLRDCYNNAGMTAQHNIGSIINLKENYSLDFQEEVSTQVKLPDGSLHTLENSYIKNCIKCLFESSTHTSLDKLIYQGIMASDIYCRKDLFPNIILSGGNTLISGFSKLLLANLEKLVGKRHNNSKVRLVEAPERLYAPWIGGSIIASLSYMKDFWIEKGTYEDCGPKVLHDRLINPCKL